MEQLLPVGSNRRGSQSGFTLLELLLTIVIFGGGLFALVEALSRGIAANTESENTAQAAALAQEALEDSRVSTRSAGDFATIVSAATATVSGFPYFTRNIVVSTPGWATNANAKRVDVTVAWQVKGSTLTTALSTYVTRSH
jgi:prepilin-type N-terminal cleavage/methylation domain-containing protein